MPKKAELQFYEADRDIQAEPICWQSKAPSCTAHYHRSMEIIYVEKGCIEAVLNYKKHTVHQGEAVLIPGCTIHSISSDRQVYVWIYTIPDDICKDALEQWTFENPVVHCGDKESRVYRLMECFINISKCLPQHLELTARAAVKGYIYLMLSELTEIAGITQKQSKKASALTREIMDYLETHYLEKCELKEISGQFGYSASRFSHIFNEAFGCSFAEYVNGLRCSHARKLMKDGKMTLTQIAMESGFQTTRTFYRAFHKCYGVSPGDFR